MSDPKTLTLRDFLTSRLAILEGEQQVIVNEVARLKEAAQELDTRRKNVAGGIAEVVLALEQNPEPKPEPEEPDGTT